MYKSHEEVSIFLSDSFSSFNPYTVIEIQIVHISQLIRAITQLN